MKYYSFGVILKIETIHTLISIMAVLLSLDLKIKYM